jgi:Flp pilus assembly protein TadB
LGGRSSERRLSLTQKRRSAMLGLAIVLLVLWVLCVLVFKIAVFAVHILLILGVIALVMHFVRKGRRTTV